MALEVGTRLGHCNVTALIGEGGMGHVYQTTDTKLNRQKTAPQVDAVSGLKQQFEWKVAGRGLI